jgi:hypothetical protein
MARPVVRKSGEQGFALLIVFVMAAAISIGLYMELPRSVFESQRAKEETLFDRGEQYKMGIKRYYTKFQRYPATIDQLEQTNGVRYLRRKYIDPFTGKDDWKILKFGPTGEIEGSVHNKKKTGLENEKDPKQSAGSVVAGPSLGDIGNANENGGSRTGANGEDTNPALNRRPSDTGIGAQLAIGGQNAGQNGGQNAGQYGVQNGVPGQIQPQNGQYQGPPNLSGLGPSAPNPNLPNQNQQLLPGAAPNPYGAGGNSSFTGSQPNSGVPGQLTQQQYQQQMMQQYQQQLGLPGAGNRLPGGAPSSPFPGLPGQAANSQNGGQIGTPLGQNGQPGQNGQNPALQMINQLLTQPRQGVQVGQLSGGPLAGAMPSGIAGVVSKHKGQGIKVLDERTKIHEWEFVYDVRKDKSLQKGGMAPQQSGRLPGSGLNNSSGMGTGQTRQ